MMLSKIKNCIIPGIRIAAEGAEEFTATGPFVKAVAEESSKSGIMESLTTIAKFFDYLMHPAKILLSIWNWTFSMSYIICLLLATFSILMIILGYPKFKSYLGGSIIGYFLINIINALIKGTL